MMDKFMEEATHNMARLTNTQLVAIHKTYGSLIKRADSYGEQHGGQVNFISEYYENLAASVTNELLYRFKHDKEKMEDFYLSVNDQFSY